MYHNQYIHRHGIVRTFGLKIFEKGLKEPIEIGKDHMKLGYKYCAAVTMDIAGRAMFTHFVETNMYVIPSLCLFFHELIKYHSSYYIFRREIKSKFGNHNCFNISRYAQMIVNPFLFDKCNHTLRSKMKSANTNHYLMYVYNLCFFSLS